MQLKEFAKVLSLANPENTKKYTKQSTSLSFSHQSEWNCWMCQYKMAMAKKMGKRVCYRMDMFKYHLVQRMFAFPNSQELKN